MNIKELLSFYSNKKNVSVSAVQPFVFNNEVVSQDFKHFSHGVYDCPYVFINFNLDCVNEDTAPVTVSFDIINGEVKTVQYTNNNKLISYVLDKDYRELYEKETKEFFASDTFVKYSKQIVPPEVLVFDKLEEFFKCVYENIQKTNISSKSLN